MSKQISVFADNIDELRKFKDKQFKIAIVDPPYFSGPEKRMFYGKSVSTTKVKRSFYPVIEDWEIPGPEYFEQLFRVSEHQIIWGVNYFDWKFGPGRIVWDKVNGNNSFSDCEIAYCSLHDSVRLFRFMWNGMCQGKSMYEGHIMQGNKKLNEKRIHQTQKPVILYKWTFMKYVKPGWNILDTHLGSGSARIAAYDLDLEFYGIEKNKTAFDREEKRFKKYVSSVERQTKCQFKINNDE